LLPFHSTENWFWKEPLNGIEEAVAELNHFRIEVKEFLFDQFNKKEFSHKAEEILRYSPDVLIAAPVFNQETRDLFDSCTKSGIPFVSVNDNLKHGGQLSFVGQDPFRSGAVAGHLMFTGIKTDGKILIVSIAQDLDNYNHILYREKGFRQFWSGRDHTREPEIISQVFPEESYQYIREKLEQLFIRHPEIRGIFVTNSRVYQVARYLKSTGRESVMLIGYDLVDPNIRYLNDNTIDFLISQKPREQGYKAAISAFNALRLHKKTSPEQLIPIDIICKENLCCYQV
jgi:LacI family transcriptional regulator